MDRTPQEPRPHSPFEDLPGSVDVSGPEKTPPPTPRRDLQPEQLDVDPIPTFAFNDNQKEKPRKPRKGTRGEREKPESGRSREKPRPGSEHKRKPRKPRTPHGTESPGKIPYEKVRRKTEGEDAYGASDVMKKISESERDKLTTPIVDANNGEVKKQVENFNAKNSGGENKVPVNDNFKNVFMPNPALDNGPLTPKNLISSVSSNGSTASQSTEPASPMTGSAPPTPVNDMPLLQEAFHWRKGELIGSVSYNQICFALSVSELIIMIGCVRSCLQRLTR